MGKLACWPSRKHCRSTQYVKLVGHLAWPIIVFNDLIRIDGCGQRWLLCIFLWVHVAFWARLGRALLERRRTMGEVATLSLDAFSRCASPGSAGQMCLPRRKAIAASQTIASRRTWLRFCGRGNFEPVRKWLWPSSFERNHDSQ